MPRANGSPVFDGVVALDGPSGTGKSTVARRLAGRIGARYLDTGAMYRAATAVVLRAGVDPADGPAVRDALRDLAVDISTDPDTVSVGVAGVDLTAEIRGAPVTQAVSAVSALPAVRERLVAQQRDLIGAGGIVVEGRDIASVVWPQAEVKVYLTAAPDVRARRRAGDLPVAAVSEASASVADIAADLHRRDTLDRTRAVSPLVHADGAVELDTSDLDIDGVVDAVVALLPGPAPRA